MNTASRRTVLPATASVNLHGAEHGARIALYLSQIRMLSEDQLKLSLDELRMQMLGAQVLFGFSLQGTFQTGFDDLSVLARWLHALGMILIMTTIGLSVAPACQHRLIERAAARHRVAWAHRSDAHRGQGHSARAQALLGFQFIVTLTTVFEKLAPHVRVIHFIALCAVTLATILLIAPAAIHRMTFRGTDSESFHHLGSFIITLALVPLIMGMSADACVAGSRVLNNERIGIAMGLSTFAVLMSLWYVTPLVLRRRYA